MTQLERLRQGIIKKHAKGDRESVRILGKRYKELQNLEAAGTNESSVPSFEDKFDAAQAATSNQQQNVEDNPISNNYEGTVLHSFARTPAKIARGVNQFGYNLLPEHMQKEADKFYNTNIADNFDSVDRLAEGGLNEDVRQTEAKFQKQRAAQGREGFDAGAFAGDLLFTAPALMAKPFQIAKGAKDVWNATNMAKAAGQGAVIEGVQPVTKEGNYWDNKISDTASVAGVSALGGPLSAGLARILSPKLSTTQQIDNTLVGPKLPLKYGHNESAARLLDKNITPSMGQLLGGQAKRLEDTMTYYPGAGQLINATERKAQRNLNKASYDIALKHIGKSSRDIPAGAEGLNKLGKIFDDEYDSVLKGTSFKISDDFVNELQDVASKASGLSDGHEKDFYGIVQKVVDLMGNKAKVDKALIKGMKPGSVIKLDDPNRSRILQGGFGKGSPSGALANLQIGKELTGREFKEIQSILRKDLKKFSGADGLEAREADLIGELIETIQDHFYASNPAKQVPLQNVDRGYHNYKIIQGAAVKKGAQTDRGFTVSDLGDAVKQADRSVGKRGFSEGRTNLQRLYNDAIQVLGDKSLQNNAMRLGHMGHAGAAFGSAFGIGGMPAALALAAGSAIPYLSPKLTSKAFTKRPDFAPKLADSLRRYGPRGAAAISANE
tara:strand:+ start:907 stop:2904 length:1998 start_codon:yes stop_codon:yes gene_type:complete